MKRIGLIPSLFILVLLSAACRDQEPTAEIPTVEVVVPAASEGEEGTSPIATQVPEEETPPAVDQPPAADRSPEALGAQPRPVTVLTSPEPMIIKPPIATPYEPGSTVQHTVNQGEWLMQIARCYGAAYRDVLDANPTFYPDYLVPGSTVSVPNIGSNGPIGGPPCVELYTIQAGDTWTTIAAKFNSDVTTLQRTNPGPLSNGRQISIPVIAQPTAALPPLTHDLLFNLDGALALWNRNTGNVEVISFGTESTLLDLATDKLGSTVLLKLTRDGAITVDYVQFLPDEGTLTFIQERLQPVDNGGLVDDMAVGAAGNWAAFVNLANNGEAWLQTYATAEPGLVSVTPRTDRVQEGFVPHLFAGLDYLLWQDNNGVDMYTDMDYLRLSQLPTDPPNVVLFLETKAQRPNGTDFLMVGSFPEGQAYFVLTANGGLVQVPNSGAYVNAAAASWLADGRLVVVSPPLSTDATGPDMAIYELQTGPEFALVESTGLSLPGHNTGAAVAGYAVSMPAMQPLEGKVMMAITTEDNAGQGLYTIDQTNKTIEKVNEWPGAVHAAYWVPDGSGVLVDIAAQEGKAGNVLYISAGSQPAFSLADWLGFQLGGFNWVQ